MIGRKSLGSFASGFLGIKVVRPLTQLSFPFGFLILAHRVAHSRWHPEVFHREEVDALNAASRKVRWDPGELAIMATFESQTPGLRPINQEIRARVLPHRSVEAIKGARRMKTYKDRVKALETRGGPSGSVPVALTSPMSANGYASPTTPRAGPSGLEPPTHHTAEDVICTYVHGMSMAVYPRLVESLHFDIQSTGQKSHCVNIYL